jgi:hypothetical protein
MSIFTIKLSFQPIDCDTFTIWHEGVDKANNESKKKQGMTTNAKRYREFMDISRQMAQTAELPG